MWFKLIFFVTIVVGYGLKMASVTGRENDVQCNYILGAQIYMRLIEGLLVDEKLLAKVPQNSHISYTKQAAKINATLYNAAKMRNARVTNLMWIFTVYAERVLVYMKSVINSGLTENQANVLSVHNSVKKLNENYIESDDCVGYRKESDFEIESTIDDLQDLLTTLEFKTSQLSMQGIDTNAIEMNTNSTAGYERFTFKVLCLNGLLADIPKTKRILESSGVQVIWDGVLENLKKQHLLGTQDNNVTLSQQIESLITLNDKFIVMVKVIMIRLMLKYTEYMAYTRHGAVRLGAFIHGKTLHGYKTKIFHDFKTIERHLDIVNNEDVKRVKKLTKHTAVFTDVDRTIAKIKFDLHRLSKQLYNVEVWRSFDDPKVSIKISCKRIVQDVEHFVKSLKDALPEINFSIVGQFKQLINTIEYKQLVEYEKTN